MFTFGSFDTQVNLQCTVDLYADPSIQNTVNSRLIVDESDLTGKCFNKLYVSHQNHGISIAHIFKVCELVCFIVAGNLYAQKNCILYEL